MFCLGFQKTKQKYDKPKFHFLFSCNSVVVTFYVSSVNKAAGAGEEEQTVWSGLQVVEEIKSQLRPSVFDFKVISLDTVGMFRKKKHFCI